MPILEELRKAANLHDIAALLGYKPSALSFILYKIPTANKYTTFPIPKKGGGERIINAPIPHLKVLQKRLSKILYSCANEIDAKSKRKNSLSHAFRPRHSIITNARQHKSRRYVLNLDLKDFFPSLNFGRVRGFFLKNNDFMLQPPVATILAQIVCNGDALPQGSPCSPIISELVTHFLDIRLVQLAAMHKCTYTRYADDITISTNQKDFPEAMALEGKKGWKLGKELRGKIEHSGFKINDSKTRMQFRGSRQSVTGLIVNEKVNVSEDYYKLTRAMTHSYLTTGSFIVDGEKSASIGLLEGRLNHVYDVKEREIDRQILLEKNEEKRKKLFAERAGQKRLHASAIRVLYHKLLVFKNFFDPKSPLIVCEGPTDPIYLKCAIRSYAAEYPKLIKDQKGSLVSNVRFFKYSAQSKDILQLRGGSPDFEHFLRAWKELTRKETYRPMLHPVILFIDNDDGAKTIFKIMSSLFNVTASVGTDLPFYRLNENLYLVKTPKGKADAEATCIENFFPIEVLQTQISGKTFNIKKDHESPTEYGKVWLAEKVVRPNADKIDFSGFKPMLDRIVSVMDDYEAVKAVDAKTAKLPKTAAPKEDAKAKKPKKVAKAKQSKSGAKAKK